MKPNKNKQIISEIYTSITTLMELECWGFLEEYFFHLSQRVWRTDVDILIAYARVSLSGKSKIPSRERFITVCKQMRHDAELWEGLD